MKKNLVYLLIVVFAVLQEKVLAQKNLAINPVIHADVPDISMIRVGGTY